MGFAHAPSASESSALSFILSKNPSFTYMYLIKLAMYLHDQNLIKPVLHTTLYVDVQCIDNFKFYVHHCFIVSRFVLLNISRNLKGNLYTGVVEFTDRLATKMLLRVKSKNLQWRHSQILRPAGLDNLKWLTYLDTGENNIEWKDSFE